MKLYERINYILIGTLWSLAMVLILDFWLNTAYNFNIFSSTHWHFVSQLQAENKPIVTGFYLAIILSITVGILGLYVLYRPRFRKIILNSPKKNDTNIDTPINAHEQKQESNTLSAMQKNNQPIIQRPPHLHIQPHQVQPKQFPKNDTQTPTKQPKQARYTDEIREIFEKNNYKVLTPKTISGVPLSLIALGTNETIWLGACDTSHEKMADMLIALKSVFNETLNGIEIDVNAFIIKPSDDKQIDAILDLDSLEALDAAISEVPNPQESDADKESGNMDAFTGYIETVITYLGNK